MFDIEAITDTEAFHTSPARDERGMTTAEYAVGTVAAVGFAGVLIKILTSEEVREIILQLILALIQFFLGQLPTLFG